MMVDDMEAFPMMAMNRMDAPMMDITPSVVAESNVATQDFNTNNPPIQIRKEFPETWIWDELDDEYVREKGFLALFSF